MPNKSIRLDFLFSLSFPKKSKNAQIFFRMRIRPELKKNLSYSFVLHLFGFDIKQTSWQQVHWLRLHVRLKIKNLLMRYSQKHICNCEVLITCTSRLSLSVENVLAYFIDTEMFSEVQRLYLDKKNCDFFRFSRWSVPLGYWWLEINSYIPMLKWAQK